MNSLPFEPEQFIFWHMHPIKEQKQLIVQSSQGVSQLGYRHAGVASQELLNLIVDC